MWLHRFRALMLVVVMLVAAGMSVAQDGSTPDPRAVTGGAQTLEDILARQRGERIDDSFRRDATGNPDAAAPIIAPLGTLGGASDADIYRAYRYGTADITSSVPGELGKVVIQDGGMRWLKLREGLLPTYGGYLMLGMLVLLLLFFLIRGKIRLDGELTGRNVMRFKMIERVAHWSMAIPFILLALTGLLLLFGRSFFIPLLGKEMFSLLATGGKYLHNYIAWVFMAGLALSFVLWVAKNFPIKADIVWMLKGGGFFTKGVHPPAGKFNAGEKIIFWIVIWFGLAISVTGLALIFPFEIEFFGVLFGFLNDLGIPQMLGQPELATVLSPQEEMQYSQLVHTGIAFVFIAVIFAHIYLGSVGMEGAYAAMTTGKVDVQWAKEHHNLWYAEIADAAEDAPGEVGTNAPAE